MAFWVRLNDLMEKNNLSQRDMEKITGLRQPSISRWQTGILPKADIVLKIAKYFNVSVEYLIDGAGEGKDGEILLTQGAAKIQGRRIVPFSPNQDDIVVHVPFYEDVKASTGHGIEAEDFSSIRTVPILHSFITPYNPKTVRTLEVTGDSMSKIHLFSGDVVFFVPVENPSDGLYVIGIEERLYVKRLAFDILGKEIRIISENDLYPPKILTGDDMNRLQVIGKVIGWITRHSQ